MKRKLVLWFLERKCERAKRDLERKAERLQEASDELLEEVRAWKNRFQTAAILSKEMEKRFKFGEENQK